MAARHIPALPDESPLDLNAAIQGTEQEILNDAMGNDPLDNDGDTSLEEMDEYADGEDTDEGDRKAEEQELVAQGEGEGGEEAEGEAEPQQGQQPDQDARGRQPAVPAWRQRETQERLRQVEQERDHLARTREAERSEIAELHGRLDNLMAQLAARGAPPPQGGVAPGADQQAAQADPQPDMFADPQGYQRWVDRRIDARAREIAAAQVDQTFQRNNEMRVNQSLDAAANGPRHWEFARAYNTLTQLNPRDATNQRLVRAIFNAPDPAAVFWDWWDQNAPEDHGREVYEQLSQRFGSPQPRGNDNGRVPQGGGRPRTEFRGPVTASRNPPSLNSQPGHGGGQRGIDPRTLDGSDRATFAYAFDDRG